MSHRRSPDGAPAEFSLPPDMLTAVSSGASVAPPNQARARMSKVWTALCAILVVGLSSARVAVAEIIVDDMDVNTTRTGTWSVSSGADPWNGRSLYNNGGNTFQWLPTIAVAGTYEGYAWWTYHANRSSAVPYRISHAGGITETIVNQHDLLLGGQWNLIGTVPMDAGQLALRRGFERERSSLCRRGATGVGGFDAVAADGTSATLLSTTARRRSSPSMSTTNLPTGRATTRTSIFSGRTTRMAGSRPTGLRARASISGSRSSYKGPRLAARSSSFTGITRPSPRVHMRCHQASTINPAFPRGSSMSYSTAIE